MTEEPVRHTLIEQMVDLATQTRAAAPAVRNLEMWAEVE